MSVQPLILLTNDDGITSQGLWAAAAALLPLGELLVIAPERQWSGAGRSMPKSVTGAYSDVSRELAGRLVRAYAIDATPAQIVGYGMLELAPRRPALVVSGINFGENLSTEVTISGTVGAALEAAAYGTPALAVSLGMAVAHHLTGNDGADYRAAQAFTQRFARLLLATPLPYDADMLNINVPETAKPETPWRLTRLSRRRYFESTPPDRANGKHRPGYRVMDNPANAEPGSDVQVFAGDAFVSVTPLSLDLTARTDFGALEEELRQYGMA